MKRFLGLVLVALVATMSTFAVTIKPFKQGYMPIDDMGTYIVVPSNTVVDLGRIHDAARLTDKELMFIVFKICDTGLAKRADEREFIGKGDNSSYTFWSMVARDLNGADSYERVLRDKLIAYYYCWLVVRGV